MEVVENLYHELGFFMDSDYEHGRCKDFAGILKRKREWLFRFVVEKDVEPTNDSAERLPIPSGYVSEDK
ncbi:hypothetical protein Thermo_00532 [Thermoplasmatales archaeon]|nr:hypothetical protein Thermo_00532 [Thermoplasmatales archaeon]